MERALAHKTASVSGANFVAYHRVLQVHVPAKRLMRLRKQSLTKCSPPETSTLVKQERLSSAIESHLPASPSNGNGSHHSSTDHEDDGEESTLLPGLALEMESSAETSSGPAWVAWGGLAGIALLLGGGYLFRDQIKSFMLFFIDAVDDWGAWGYAAYAAVYIILEVLAVPAVPLTATAGVIFGPTAGTAMVSVSGTIAATIAFLIARYAARDKVLKWAKKNPKFEAIDRAIGRDGFKFVTLLRLSPLLPLAVSNYLYGLTSVELGPYVLGSWLGMLPGTYAYVSAGHVSKAVLIQGEGAIGVDYWQVGLGLGVTVLVLLFVGRLAKQALDEVDEEQKQEQQNKKV